MPVYEYECTSCSETFERFQSVGSRAPRRCPACHTSGTVRKRVSAPAFHLKGSGWYVTDYANKGAASKAATKGGDDSGSPKSKGESAAPDSSGSTSSEKTTGKTTEKSSG